MATATPTVPLWIGGSAAAPRSTRVGEVTNASTGQVVRRVPYAGAEDVDRAVAAAAAAFPAWRATPPLRRARVLSRFRELAEQHHKGHKETQVSICFCVSFVSLVVNRCR